MQVSLAVGHADIQGYPLSFCAPEQDQVRLSVVRTGTATVRTGMLGRYLATSRAVLPPRVSTTIRLACTCGTSNDHEFGICWMHDPQCTGWYGLDPG